MSEPVISIITACFNHGKYIEEAVESVRSYDWKFPVEHIIVNDGSTDVETIRKLAELKQKGINIIDQLNAGPANARNSAVAESSGKYILPLDADNILRPKVFTKAFKLMEDDIKISVVYTDAWCFGAREFCLKPGRIDIPKILSANYLDTCALIRKESFVAVGGYDDKIPVHGNEDWELWLKMIFNKMTFYYLEEVGFEYRVINDSLSRRESTPKQEKINEYIVQKYASEYAKYYRYLYQEIQKYENLKSFLKQNKLKSVLKVILNKNLIQY